MLLKRINDFVLTGCLQNVFLRNSEKKKEKEEEVNILLALEDKLHNLKVFCSLRRAFSAIHHDRVFINE